MEESFKGNYYVDTIYILPNTFTNRLSVFEGRKEAYDAALAMNKSSREVIAITMEVSDTPLDYHKDYLKPISRNIN